MQVPKTYTCILGKSINSRIYVSLNIKVKGNKFLREDAKNHPQSM